ncbi:DUF2189 domain-containing protein [Solemya elarraichensis gill symbiont]|uniref:DUF2189 domain-containing protein n=1 Tax=Solemya elarraichensis gill symbiont TaxID=1918949 RepID=A0A1T2LBJ4_9GAMM|nr:DUF2189 domain-containing protein [Solemya elarraichensis gill symbiont]OOZ42461.1 hypothetical protein BOW52_03115 [Solemya elarraichensis gill symbiont]
MDKDKEVVVERDENGEEIRPLLISANSISVRAPFEWLAKGWADIKRAPVFSVTYGAVIVLIAALVFWLVYQGGHTTMLFTIGIGALLTGPVLAFGLYSISRQIELGLEPRFGYCIKESSKHMRNEMLFVLILLIWARAASMVLVFFPISDDIGIEGWLEFLAVGSIVGSFFASLVFVTSAFSLPLMLDRNTDAITSALTSINAVLNNKLAMLVWAILIVGLILLGIVTMGLGMFVIFPLIGHASWHAYRETIKQEE